jgi:hypothetical protein
MDFKNESLIKLQPRLISTGIMQEEKIRKLHRQKHRKLQRP